MISPAFIIFHTSCSHPWTLGFLAESTVNTHTKNTPIEEQSCC